MELQIDSAGTIVGCKALNELCKNCQGPIIEVFEKIPGNWSGCEEPLVKRLIFPLEFRMNIWGDIDSETEFKLPEGKLMPKIVLSAISSQSQ